MLRGAASKIMWVGRATVFLVGLAVILALAFGLASAALAGVGVGAPFNLGQTNTVDRMSSLVGSHAGAMLRVENDGTGTALDLRVGPTNATPANNTVTPMRVNSQKVVPNLNADKVDGIHARELAPRGYAHVGPFDLIATPPRFYDPDSSKGVIGVMRKGTGASTLYCFNLNFEPEIAVASAASQNNNATVGVSIPASGCDAPFTDASAKTFGANDSIAVDHVFFNIVFI
jgi:hypothetical protein